MRVLLHTSSGLLLLLVLLCATIHAVPVTDSPEAATTTLSSITTTETSSEESQESQEEVDKSVNTPLETSLESFLALVPADKIQNLTTEAYLEGSAVREASNFIKSREFSYAKDKLLDAPEVQAFVKFLNDSGLNLLRFVRKVGVRTGIPVTINTDDEEESKEVDSSEEQQVVVSSESATVLTQLVDKVLAELPQEQFFALFFEKMESDTEFSEFVEKLNGDEFEGILLKVQESKALDQFQKTMLDHNMNLEKIWNSMKIFFGWGNNF